MKFINFISQFLLFLVLLTQSYFANCDAYYMDSLKNHETVIKSNLKIKISAIRAKSKGTIISDQKPLNSNVNTNLINQGFGATISNTIFFNQNIATEIGLSMFLYHTTQNATDSILLNYGTASGISTAKKRIYQIPLDLALQYYIAPYGGVSPYFGAGLSAAYCLTGSKAAFRINKIAKAPLIQLGINFIAQDNTFFTIEVKKYFLANTIYYKSSFLGTTEDLESKLTINPIIFSLGISFEF